MTDDSWVKKNLHIKSNRPDLSVLRAPTSALFPFRSLILILIITLIGLLIEEKLHKDRHVQKQRSQTPGDPARVDGNIPRINRPGLPGLAMARFPTDRRICDDRHDVRQISNAGEQEKQQRDALGAFALVVEQQLWHSRPEVESRAEVAEGLAQGVELEGFGLLVLGRVAVPVEFVGGDPPAEDAGGADQEDGEAVEQHGLEHGGGPDVLDGRRVAGLGGVEQRRHGRQVRSVDRQMPLQGTDRSRPVPIVLVPRRRLRRHRAAVQQWPRLHVPVRMAVRTTHHLVRQCEAAVVEHLDHQHDVRQRVIDRQDDHGRQHPLEHGAEDVEHISRQPDDEKHNREPLGRAPSEVLDDLRREHHHPARD